MFALFEVIQFVETSLLVSSQKTPKNLQNPSLTRFSKKSYLAQIFADLKFPTHIGGGLHYHFQIIQIS